VTVPARKDVADILEIFNNTTGMYSYVNIYVHVCMYMLSIYFEYVYMHGYVCLHLDMFVYIYIHIYFHIYMSNHTYYLFIYSTQFKSTSRTTN
jgi:hypothetical protein